MPRYSSVFFVSAVLFLCTGIGLGVYMAASHDHGFAPLHAHINLLGWVSSAIMGLFYAHAGDRLKPGRIWVQFVIYTFGITCLNAGLATVLLGDPVMLLIHTGTITTIVGILMFGAAVCQIAFARQRAA